MSMMPWDFKREGAHHVKVVNSHGQYDELRSAAKGIQPAL